MQNGLRDKKLRNLLPNTFDKPKRSNKNRQIYEANEFNGTAESIISVNT